VSRFKDLDVDRQNEAPSPDLAVRRVRGRRANNRGKAYEREVAATLGGQRVGQFGSKTDVAAGGLQVQCKTGKSYPERLDGWLRSVTVKADQVRALVVSDSPGSGTRRRSLIVFDLDEFVAHYVKGDE
jgi:hypothetical protein